MWPSDFVYTKKQTNQAAAEYILIFSHSWFPTGGNAIPSSFGSVTFNLLPAFQFTQACSNIRHIEKTDIHYIVKLCKKENISVKFHDDICYERENIVMTRLTMRVKPWSLNWSVCQTLKRISMTNLKCRSQVKICQQLKAMT